jgi:uncharacterized membrane protein
MKTTQFYGHGVLNLGINVALALTAPLTMWILCWMIKRSWNWLICFFMAWITFLFIPNAMYLAFEFRHIIQQDNVADNYELVPVIIFALLCLFGIALSVWTIRLGVTLPIFRLNPICGVLGVLLLSYACALGAVFGLLRYNSKDAIFNPGLLLNGLEQVKATSWLLGLTLSVGLGLACLCLVTEAIYQWITALKSSKKQLAPIEQ